MGIVQKIRKILDRSATPVTTDDGGYVVIEGTGEAIETDGGTANTGYSGPAPKRGQSIELRGTGNATSTGGGEANTGISFT